MVSYECPRCGQEFGTKQHFHRHQKTLCHNKVAELRATVAQLQNEVQHLPSANTNTKTKALKFIDLFCGIGGFHQAFASLGAECVLACDIDEKCRAVYKNNYGLEPKPDVTKLLAADIPDFDILCAGFPCQAFSHAGHQNGFEDTRGTLFRDICRILLEKKPKYFLLENVKNLKGHDKGKTWATIYKCLTESGYKTYETPLVLSPHQLGVPQHRERVLILGWRADLLPSPLPLYPKLSPPADTNIRSILTDDCDVPPETRLSGADISVLDMWEEVIQHFKSANVKLPTFPMWSDDWDSTYDLLASEPLATKDADESEEEKASEDEGENADEEAKEDAEEEVKETNQSFKIPVWKQKFIRQNREFFQAHNAFLAPWLSRARLMPQFANSKGKRKMEWQAGKFLPTDSIWSLLFQFRPSGIRIKRANYSPALVAMAQIVYVGEKRRKLSPREVGRLQSFPDSFKLPDSPSVAYKQFGNSVNVEVIKHAARFLLKGGSV